MSFWLVFDGLLDVFGVFCGRLLVAVAGFVTDTTTTSISTISILIIILIILIILIIIDNAPHQGNHPASCDFCLVETRDLDTTLFKETCVQEDSVIERKISHTIPKGTSSHQTQAQRSKHAFLFLYPAEREQTQKVKATKVFGLPIHCLIAIYRPFRLTHAIYLGQQTPANTSLHIELWRTHRLTDEVPRYQEISQQVGRQLFHFGKAVQRLGTCLELHR